MSAHALLFTGLCAIQYNDLKEVIIILILLMGLFLALSAIYSMCVSELSIGHVYEMWDEYDNWDDCKKKYPYPHRVSLAPVFIMNSRMRFLMFFKFAPNVLFTSWFVLILVAIEHNLQYINIPISRNIQVIILFLILLFCVCIMTAMYHELLLGKLRKERIDDSRRRKQQEKKRGYCRSDCRYYSRRCCQSSDCIRMGGHKFSVNPLPPSIYDNRNCSDLNEKCIDNESINFSCLSIYHIMIDRFCGNWTTNPTIDSDGFYGGDIQGIINKLDYISSLGYNAILLTPIFATRNYHGYHVTNYEEVDTHFGSWNDFQNLIMESHKKGIKVICDYVPNHCHLGNAIFQSAQNNVDSKYKNWFYFDESRLGGFVSYQNYPDLPKFNLHNSATAEYMISVAVRMAKMGIDGLRIDHAIGVPFSFLRELSAQLKRINPQIFIIGEAWLQNPRDFMQIEFINARRKDLAMNYSTMNNSDIQEMIQLDYAGVLDGILDFSFMNILVETVCSGERLLDNQQLRRRLEQHFSRYPVYFTPFVFVDNHDTNRFLYYCRNDRSLLQEAICLMSSLPYPMIVYYGTEDSMCNDEDINNSPNGDDDVRAPKRWK